jgi:hypothetical protein
VTLWICNKDSKRIWALDASIWLRLNSLVTFSTHRVHHKPKLRLRDSISRNLTAKVSSSVEFCRSSRMCLDSGPQRSP